MGFVNLYPVGEGAGYAGGIVSAAVDGLEAARADYRWLAERDALEAREVPGYLRTLRSLATEGVTVVVVVHDVNAASQMADDAVLLGAIGGPKWDGLKGADRPEAGLLAMRRTMGVWANLRIIKPFPAGAARSPVKLERLEGTDMIFVRELTGGIYFGDKTRNEDRATDECAYTVAEIERVARRAGELARSRRGKVASIDKANVLETSRLWRAVVTRVFAEEFADVALEHILVDAASMHLITNPARFDVIVTENMFGDILSDEASLLTGSLGMLPSASLGDSARGLYEPIHGSAPDIAGKDIANPCGAIASAALLLRHSLGLNDEADMVERAIRDAIRAGGRTADIAGPDDSSLSTTAMTDLVIQKLS